MSIINGGKTWDYNEPFVLSFNIAGGSNAGATMTIVLDGVTIYDNWSWGYDDNNTMSRLAEYINVVNYGNSARVTRCIFPVYSSITMTPSNTVTIQYVRVYKYVEA